MASRCSMCLWWPMYSMVAFYLSRCLFTLSNLALRISRPEASVGIVIRPGLAGWIVQRTTPRSSAEAGGLRTETGANRSAVRHPPTSKLDRSQTMPAHAVILRPNPFGSFSAGLLILLTILVMLGIAAHAAVL